MAEVSLTELDQKIIGALMVRPRASWSRIAQVVGAPERTVSRRGAELLESGVVAIRGLPQKSLSALVGVKTVPGTTPLASRSLSARDDTTFVYEVTGSEDCLMEVLFDLDTFHSVLTEDVPAIPGVRSLNSNPIVGYFKTLQQWRPGLLDAHQRQALGDAQRPVLTTVGMVQPLDQTDDPIASLLISDGRASAEDIGRRLGVSESTVRRRLSQLTKTGGVHLRAVVDPASIGLPVEVLVWIKAAPAQIEHIGRLLAASPETRYVAALIGEYQILADYVVPTMGAFYELTSHAAWADAALHTSTSLVVRAHKRGGHRYPNGGVGIGTR